MDILKLIAVNWDSVLLAIAVAVLLIVLYSHGWIEVVKKVLFSLVSRAEKEFGSGTGKLKNAAVNGFTRKYQKL